MREERDNLFLGGRITAAFFLATLNRQRDFKREREHFRSVYGSSPGLHQAFVVISEALPRHLLRHTDAWIASGRNVDGFWEVPRRRALDFNGLSRIQGWLSLQGSSTITISELTGKVSLDLCAFEIGGTPIADPDESAAEEAARMFLWFLNEEKLRYAIAKCAKCQDFYFRVKPHSSYKKASFCPDCRPSASTGRRMEEVRRERKDSRIDSAIRAHRKWLQLSLRSRARFRDEKTYIVRQIGKEFGVTGNWLTRHQHQIFQDQPPPQLSKAAVSERAD